MKLFLRYAKLYWHFFVARLKVMMEYRIDFLIGVASVICIQGSAILFIGIVFNQINELNGWSFYEIMFIYGIASTGRSIHHIFFDNLWTLGWGYIRPGNFDRLLIRPVNPLFQLVADRVQQDGFGQLLFGLVVLGTSMPQIDVQWGPLNLLWLLIMIVSSGMIFVAVNLIMATLSFWMTDSLPITWSVHNLSDFTRYPMTIFHKSIRLILTWVIPYGFTAFYPATYFIGHSGFQQLAVWTPVVAIVLSCLAYRFWCLGLRSFVSTGN